jgi:hypothetical protein
MSQNAPTYRVQRALRPNELQSIVDGITAATNPRAVEAATVLGTLGPLLADDGITLSDPGPQRPVNPAQYAIPASQWNAITALAINRCGEWGTGATLALDLVNRMPGSYETPGEQVSLPTVTARDYRPPVHDVQISREACDVITACTDHVQNLRNYFGTDSPTYQQAADSWHRLLTGLLSMSLGATTRIRRDGDLSLFVTTGSGLVYGVIFHPARRHCTIDGCQAHISDDGTAHRTYEHATVLDHEHRPSYPVDAPQPGLWSFHS